MRAAASVLASADSLAGLVELVLGTGLAGAPEPLSPSDRASLGLDAGHDAAHDVLIAAGPGAIRILLVHGTGQERVRDMLPRLAERLSRRAPHVLWLIAACDGNGGTGGTGGTRSAALGAVRREVGRSPRVAALVWDTGRVLDSDAETLCALAALRGDDDGLLHSRSFEVLGREALTHRFYRILQARVEALAAGAPSGVPVANARGVALLHVSRLLFLQFLEAKGWMDGDRDFVASRFDDCMRAGGGFHQRVLLPLFFGTLNTPPARRAPRARQFGRIPFLNGGLFARSAIERRVGRWRFTDAQCGELLAQLFQRFRFVAREDSATWSEAAVDPEMLGRAFESLMAPDDRKSGGVFYTPHPLVARVADEALDALLPARARTRDSLRRLRVLDPACGSGAFLVHALERLAELCQQAGEGGTRAMVRRDVLARSIFGVDRDATAVWLCELRLWLSVVVESDEVDPLRVPPLPNLDRNIRVGDSLAGAGFEPTVAEVRGSRRLAQLRERYVRATGPRKQTLARVLDREERMRAVGSLDRQILAARHARRELLLSQRSRDLFGERITGAATLKREAGRLRDLLRTLTRDRARLRDGSTALPFSFPACFADVQAGGGFDVVIGNPPWVRLHHIPAAMRLSLKRSFTVYRAAPWAAGAAGARAAPGFAAQVDLAALFVERALTLLRPDGVLALLLPVKLWHSLAGGGVRRLLLERGALIRVEDLSDSRHAFAAAVYPSLVVARRGVSPASTVAVARHSRATYEEWTVPAGQLPFDETQGAPWVLLPPDASAAFHRVRQRGPALAAAGLGAPRLGVKSGHNVAFVVRVEDSTRDVASIVDRDGERGKVEVSLLRPVLRGDGITPWRRRSCDEWILWTHDTHGPLRRLPPRADAWLRARYGALSSRVDATNARRWWALFRTEAASPAVARLVWSDFGLAPRALVLPVGDPTVPLNSCYVLPCRVAADAWALAAIINSPLAAGFLNAVAEPARGGYRRYLGWTMALLPLPRDWRTARTTLSDIALAQARRPDAAALHAAVLDAYSLHPRDVAPLLEPRCSR